MEKVNKQCPLLFLKKLLYEHSSEKIFSHIVFLSLLYFMQQKNRKLSNIILERKVRFTILMRRMVQSIANPF